MVANGLSTALAGEGVGGACRASGAAAPPHPAESTNRPGGNRHGGEDTVDLGWQVQWRPEAWKLLSRRLQEGQEGARAGDNGDPIVEFGDRSMVMRAAGRAAGNTYYAFVGDSEGLQFAIMDREEPWGKTPNVRVHFGAVALMVLGLDEAYRRARCTIERAGGVIEAEVVSRIDPCVDLIDLAVAEFVEAVIGGRCVRRARKAQYFEDRSRWTGVAVGMGGAISLRIYDKVAECEGTEKWTYLLACRFEGEIPDVVTRVEYQLRRRALKEFGIDTIEDWKQKRGEVLRYLIEDWFRIVAEKVDRQNTERFRACALWRTVVAGFESWVGAAERAARRIALSCFDHRQVRRQAIGCVTSLAAYWGHSVNKIEDVIDVMWDCVRDEREEGAEVEIIRRAKTKSRVSAVLRCLD